MVFLIVWSLKLVEWRLEFVGLGLVFSFPLTFPKQTTKNIKVDSLGFLNFFPKVVVVVSCSVFHFYMFISAQHFLSKLQFFGDTRVRGEIKV